MSYRWIVFFGAALAVCPATAIDIPMDRKLATEALDSKTCYSTIKSLGRLVGYELSDLLVSSSGKLVRLEALGNAAVGDGKPRRYAGHGIEVRILPRQVMRHADDEQELSITLEQGIAFVAEHGRRRRLPVEVSEMCTP